MALTNNNIYPVNSRRLTGADMIPIFGSFINDDREEQDELVYAINTGKVKRVYNAGKDIEEVSGVDINFVSANNLDVSLFKYNINSSTFFYDERGGSGGTGMQQLFEQQGYMYNGWNYLDAVNGEKINMIKGRDPIDTSVILFPELSIKKKSTDTKWTGYGISNVSTNILNQIKSPINKINRQASINTSFINIIVKDISTGIIYNNYLKDSTTYYKNETILESFKHTLENIRDKHGENTENIKTDYINYLNHFAKSLIDDALTPVNASMLRPDYEFDCDILPDTDFRYTNGIYSYCKFYSYQYNCWYFQHVNWWWRPWFWGVISIPIWWWSNRWHHHYSWFWHGWWWNWYYFPHFYGSSNVNQGETVVMCNAFKYNTYNPNEYIPIEPQKYYENNNITNSSSAAEFRQYVSYLLKTYKSNIYKINSYIKTVNKPVDKIIALCDYIVYDNDNTPVNGADINYNIIYDKYQRIDLDADTNTALSDSNMLDFQQQLNSDFSNNGMTSVPISEYSIVNGIDITSKARKYFPIKPIYLLISPKTQNNTNKIIKYKVNLYQYGNIKADSILTFIMYQMPRLITVSFNFNSGGYAIRKDTFGILGNVNNVSSSAAANVNIVTFTEFDEYETRDYHTTRKRISLGDDTIAEANWNTKNTIYKYGSRRFFNGTTTIDSVVNQQYDKTKNYNDSKKAVNKWPTSEKGELPILALNDQDHIVVFLSTLTLDANPLSGDYDAALRNANVKVTFKLYTEDNSSGVTVTLNGNKNSFKSNNYYGATNSQKILHWGKNITGNEFKAYPDVKSGDRYRNNNAVIMFSHLFGYRIYLMHWFTLQQVSTQTISVNGKRLTIDFVWINLPVVNSFWNSGDPDRN